MPWCDGCDIHNRVDLAKNELPNCSRVRKPARFDHRHKSHGKSFAAFSQFLRYEILRFVRQWNTLAEVTKECSLREEAVQ